MVNEPQITFFSGGSALKDTSRTLKKYTRRSVHIVTPFDSGGSSATLRDAFNMPAIGDLRSRLLALADESQAGNYATYKLLNYRLPKTQARSALARELESVITGTHSLNRGVPKAWQEAICRDIARFKADMPVDFDLRGASLGNLMIAGGYLENQCQLDPVIKRFCRLVNVQGYVNTGCDTPLHLAAHLTNGDYVVGQHRITGKELPALKHSINSLFLCRVDEDMKNGVVERVNCRAKTDVLRKVSTSDLICYAPGSFYSSLVANLLPQGMIEQISHAQCPKVFVPSLGIDPEVPHMSLYDRVLLLIRYLAREDSPVTDVLSTVLFDPQYTPLTALEEEQLKKLGLSLTKESLVDPASSLAQPHYCPTKLSTTLVDMAS